MTTFTIHTEDKEQLNALKAVLTALKIKFEVSQESDINDWWDQLGMNSKNSIERGLSDFKKSRTHSDQDVRNAVRKRILNAKKG